MRTLVVLCVLAAACGSKPSDSGPPPQPGSAAKPIEAAKPTGSAAPAVKPARRPAPSKEARAEFRKHMKAGWARQKDSQWAEAVVEFEAALAAVPSEQRGLSELGWSAMQAGDYPKSRMADEEAVRVAVDPKVKASALYNLGLVQDKTGDKAGALKSYQASLALRPNKIVEQAVVALGAAPEAEPVFCAAGAKPCACTLAHAYDEIERETAKCEPVTKPTLPVKTLRMYRVTTDALAGSRWIYALDEANQLVAVIEGEYERGKLSEKVELAKAELKTVAGHRVLWLETKYSAIVVSLSFDDDSMDTEDRETRALTLCVVGDGKTPTRCPLRGVPLRQVLETNKIDGDASSAKRTEAVVDVSVADDGTATVKLVKGASDLQIARFVGPHRLW